MGFEPIHFSNENKTFPVDNIQSLKCTTEKELKLEIYIFTGKKISQNTSFKSNSYRSDWKKSQIGNNDVWKASRILISFHVSKYWLLNFSIKPPFKAPVYDNVIHCMFSSHSLPKMAAAKTKKKLLIVTRKWSIIYKISNLF